MHLIGMHGYKGSGKDTAARVLVQERGFTPIAFAEPMRAMLTVMLGYTGMPSHEAAQWFDDRDKKEHPIPGIGVSYRKLAVTLGTEWGRDLIRPDLWVWIARQRIEQLAEQGAAIVVTDVRFADEAQMIRSLGGEVWLIDRPDIEADESHRSEKRLPPHLIDRGIKNDAGLSELRETVLAAQRRHERMARLRHYSAQFAQLTGAEAA